MLTPGRPIPGPREASPWLLGTPYARHDGIFARTRVRPTDSAMYGNMTPGCLAEGWSRPAVGPTARTQREEHTT